MKLIQYDTTEFNFAEIILGWFQVVDLYKLHSLKEYSLLDRKHDQSTDWHKFYYSNFRSDESFNNMYKAFLAEHVKPLYNETIVYQTIPTFRVHLAGNIAVGEYHKDKSYRDVKWAETVKELNYYLPFTNTNTLNTIWMESEEDKGDFTPALINYGECLEWDGSNLTHGNKKNETDDTRVSVDFRVMPLSRYVETESGSINMNTAFKIGGYYDKL